MGITVDVILPGFPGRSSVAGMGWCTVAIVRSGDHSMLVDTGGPGARRVVLEEFKKRKINPRDIKKVFISHMHWDHCYNADLFPQAEFVISRTEWEFGSVVSSVEPDQAPAFQGGYLPWLRSFKKKIVEGNDEELLPGVTCFSTPGHTPGSISLLLDHGDQKWAIVADSVKNRAEFSKVDVDMSVNYEQSKNSILKIKKLATRILPGHDCWLRWENGIVTPEGGNDVTLSMPFGLKVNGSENLVLHIE